VSIFPDELYPAPLSWTERAYPKLIHYNKLDKGGTLRPGSSLSSCLLRFALASDHCAKVAKATQSRLSAENDNPRAESMDSALFFLLRPAVSWRIVSNPYLGITSRWLLTGGRKGV
jgi:hypothetical protein